MNELDKGIRLFNEGSFSEAHETWECFWRSMEESADRRFLQGLIMISGAIYQYKRNEYGGTSKLLQKGIKILKEFKEAMMDVNIKDFLKEVESFHRKFERDKAGITEKDFPKIKSL